MWGRISRDSSGRGALWEQRSSHRAKRVNWVFQGVWLAETRDEVEKLQEMRDWKVLTATERVQVRSPEGVFLSRSNTESDKPVLENGISDFSIRMAWTRGLQPPACGLVPPIRSALALN